MFFLLGWKTLHWISCPVQLWAIWNRKEPACSQAAMCEGNIVVKLVEPLTWIWSWSLALHSGDGCGQKSVGEKWLSGLENHPTVQKPLLWLQLSSPSHIHSPPVLLMSVCFSALSLSSISFLSANTWRWGRISWQSLAALWSNIWRTCQHSETASSESSQSGVTLLEPMLAPQKEEP